MRATPCPRACRSGARGSCFTCATGRPARLSAGRCSCRRRTSRPRSGSRWRPTRATRRAAAGSRPSPTSGRCRSGARPRRARPGTRARSPIPHGRLRGSSSSRARGSPASRARRRCRVRSRPTWRRGARRSQLPTRNRAHEPLSQLPAFARGAPSDALDSARMTNPRNLFSLSAGTTEAAAPRAWARRRPAVKIASLPRPRPELVGLIVLAAVLNLWALSQNGWANEYYSAAVRSMASSWHNFLYDSFDPSGIMTVDKPPLALWVQALSVRVFGFHSLSMLVPQALMGVASVGLVYDLVRRMFGRFAGSVAGLALAVTPMMVAVSRHNNPDALLVL